MGVMRAAVLRASGGPPEPGEFEEPPAPEQGQAIVAVEAAGLNPADLALAAGTYYVPTPPMPYVAGVEAVGQVHASDDSELPVGTRVYVDLPVLPNGTFAERTRVYTATASRVPSELDSGVACAIGVAGMAAWLALDHRARVQPGETVLVLAATGAVGRFAVQAAKLLGAARVVAAGRNEAALAAVRELGADATVKLDGQPLDELAAAFGEAAEGGVNVVVDPLCGEPAAAALQAMAPFGRLVQLGRSASETMEVPSATLRGRMLSVLGHTNLLTPPDAKRDAYARLAAHALSGDLHVDVRRFGLDDVAAAWKLQAESPGEKLVIVP